MSADTARFRHSRRRVPERLGFPLSSASQMVATAREERRPRTFAQHSALAQRLSREGVAGSEDS
jgi:hypothetical protein